MGMRSCGTAASGDPRRSAIRGLAVVAGIASVAEQCRTVAWVVVASLSLAIAACRGQDERIKST